MIRQIHTCIHIGSITVEETLQGLFNEPKEIGFLWTSKESPDVFWMVFPAGNLPYSGGTKYFPLGAFSNTVHDPFI